MLNIISCFDTAYKRWCLCICMIYENQYIAISTGKSLSNFNILVGPYNDQLWKCGSSYNYMNTGEVVSFTCDHSAKGSALKITIKDRRAYLMLCEVLVFGKGTTYSNSHEQISNLK